MVFPASAGVILTHVGWICGKLGFPRIRGGDPLHSVFNSRGVRFSPHPRG